MPRMIKLKITEYGPVVIIEEEFLLTDPNSISKCNEYLRDLNTGLEIKFQSFKQYISLLKAITEKLNIPYLIE